MERAGVSTLLLGTSDQHWDLAVILVVTMMHNVCSWYFLVVLSFLCIN